MPKLESVADKLKAQWDALWKSLRDSLAVPPMCITWYSLGSSLVGSLRHALRHSLGIWMHHHVKL